MATKRTLTPEQELEVVRRYATGESARSISRNFTVQVHVQTIHNTLKRHGVKNAT